MENFAKLRAKLVELNLTHKQVAKAIGMDPSTFSKKINGSVDWPRKEMNALRILLCLNANEFLEIFYA